MRKELKIYPNIKTNIIFIHGIRTHNPVFEKMRDKLISDPDVGQRKENDERVNWVSVINYGYLFASLCWTRFMKKCCRSKSSAAGAGSLMLRRCEKRFPLPYSSLMSCMWTGKRS